MRNVLISRDAVAAQAGTEILQAGGNATDAVVAAMLAGAARATPAALLGSGVVLVAGAGVGAHVVDGRARAPGLGQTRGPALVDPPVALRAAVPGLLEGALGAHLRFGSLALGTLVRTAAGAVREADSTTITRARLKLLEQLPRTGVASLARAGVHQAMLEAVGPAAGGVLTRDDLAPVPPPIRPLAEARIGDYEVLTTPDDPPPRHAPPPPPDAPVDAALCADMHGTVACALWVVAPEAIALPGSSGLSLAALCNAPTKGVTRRRAGSSLPMGTPAALVRHRGAVWAGVAAAGEGDATRARDQYLRARLALAGVTTDGALAGEAGEARAAFRGLVLWVTHEGDEVRGTSEALG